MKPGEQDTSLSRRDFIRTLVLLGGAVAVSSLLDACSSAGVKSTIDVTTANTGQTITPTRIVPQEQDTIMDATQTSEATQAFESGTTQVAFVKTRDRTDGVLRAIDILGINPVNGKRVFFKPNFNSADPAPGSTHPDILRSLVLKLQEMGAQEITIGDRSGMGDTGQTMRKLGVFNLAEELGVKTIVFDELGAEDWVMIQPLKNSVGMVAKWDRTNNYNYMTELHNSPHQRSMIAEINFAYTPALIVMDGVEAFVTDGPANGMRVQSDVVLVGTDRIAMDAVGVALLRHFGTTPEVSEGLIFQQEQIARAVELGLGVDGPEKIELLTADSESANYAKQIKDVLLKG
jgi:uncharacterized protein (DUF362 family)